MQQTGVPYIPVAGYGPGTEAAPQDLGYAAIPNAYAQAAPYMPLQAPYPQPYAQPQPQPYAQPQPQPYAQPQPQALSPSLGQPYAPQVPAYAQSQPQMPAAPVAPVGFQPPNAGAPQTGQNAGAQNPFTRQMVSIARILEQTLPVYQLAISVTDHILHSPRGHSVAEGRDIITALKDAIYSQGAALGAIRRVLCGEVTADVLTGLAAAAQELTRLQNQLRMVLERAAGSAPPELRTALTTLSQTVSTADSPISQAASAALGAVGAQIWESARAKVMSFGDDDSTVVQ